MRDRKRVSTGSSFEPRRRPRALGAWLLVNDLPDRLRGPAFESGDTPDTTDAIQVWATYVTAIRVAAAIPQTVAEIRRVFRRAPTDYRSSLATADRSRP